ncbi:MAG: response regulator transcription factor [Alphaproteobacteria bacterium]|nr:response regulator transcription factor [Alphaproteobacteria bacterium]
MSEHASRGIRVLVVDDEAPARKRMIALLREDGDIGEIMEADDGTVAVDMIETVQPEVVFLDVQMPKLDGFAVIQMVGPDRMPPTVFVTAYDGYAVRAFEADASDYVVKPFSDERFLRSMARVKARSRDRQAFRFGSHVLEVVAKKAPPEGLWDRLVVKTGGLTRFVNVSDIDWVEASDVYVNLHIQGKEVLYRAALHQLGQRLNPKRFVRIHRSTIVNIERIVHLEPQSHGEFDVVLKDGSRLHLSRRYRGEFEQRLGQRL